MSVAILDWVDDVNRLVHWRGASVSRGRILAGQNTFEIVGAEIRLVRNADPPTVESRAAVAPQTFKLLYRVTQVFYSSCKKKFLEI